MSIAEKLTSIAENEQKVFDAGKTKEWSDFWDVYQDYGKRGDFYVAFYGSTWNNTTFKPKYPLKPTSLNNTFSNATISGDMTEICEIDTSKCHTIANAFSYMRNITRLGVIDMRKVTTGTAFSTNDTRLETIDKIIFENDGRWRVSSFDKCSALVNVTFVGKMGGGDINYAQSPLSVASCKSVINALYDYTGNAKANTYSFKLSEACWQALNEAETPPDGYADWQDYVTTGLKWLI